MKVYGIDHERCKTCWYCEDGRPCTVPLFKEYELFRSEQRIVNSSGDGEQPRKMPLPPCSAACPANICIQGYIALIASGRYKEALRLIRDRIPFPSICGGVCPHPCEDECTRGEYDEPIAINALKRFVAERETEEERAEYLQELKEKIAKKGKRAAVIGAGPAGLTCAHDLALRGYDVTVFEALPVPGGMMTVGIPEYRLPREILNGEIGVIEALGVEITTGVRVGQDTSLKELFARGYEAIFIAAGAHRGARLGIEGEESPGVLDALSFLREINLGGNNVKVGKRVAVIGGGDAAIDAARSALRLGAEDVFILYRRWREEMPAHREQVEAAEEEGIRIDFLVAPVRFITNSGGVEAIECQRMTLGEPDESGRRRPLPVEGSEFTVEADTVIVAIGQLSDLSFITEEYPIKLTERGTIKVGPATGETSVPGIFAGGDVVTGPKTVIHAIAAGRRAAWGIDLRLSGGEAEPVRFYEEALAERYKPGAVATKPRTKMAVLPVGERIRGFAVVEKGLSEEEAIAEAYRCLACGLCTNCNNCIDNFACPALYLEEGQVMINEELCDGCGVCAELCPNDAIIEVSVA
ncbi:MAG: NAD(P)-binding protein [Candidatus Bipolaricaulia bacterium]